MQLVDETGLDEPKVDKTAVDEIAVDEPIKYLTMTCKMRGGWKIA